MIALWKVVPLNFYYLMLSTWGSENECRLTPNAIMEHSLTFSCLVEF